MRALLLAWYAWTTVAWAPPRRHLAPLRSPRLLAAADETEVPRNVPEDAPLEYEEIGGRDSAPTLSAADRESAAARLSRGGPRQRTASRVPRE